MSKAPHIIGVSLPELPLALIAAAEEGILSAVGSEKTTTVIVSFGDSSEYEYPAVPLPLALALQANPEGVFGSIRYWPGYHRIR